jgi:hypothetical protein
MKSFQRFFLFFVLLATVQFANGQEFDTDMQQAMAHYKAGQYAEAAEPLVIIGFETMKIYLEQNKL